MSRLFSTPLTALSSLVQKTCARWIRVNMNFRLLLPFTTVVIHSFLVHYWDIAM